MYKFISIYTQNCVSYILSNTLLLFYLLYAQIYTNIYIFLTAVASHANHLLEMYDSVGQCRAHTNYANLYLYTPEYIPL